MAMFKATTCWIMPLQTKFCSKYSWTPGRCSLQAQTFFFYHHFTLPFSPLQTHAIVIIKCASVLYTTDCDQPNDCIQMKVCLCKSVTQSVRKTFIMEDFTTLSNSKWRNESETFLLESLEYYLLLHSICSG
jgi:hypothetical protein